MKTFIQTIFFSCAIAYSSASMAQDKFSIVQLPDTQAFMGNAEPCAKPSQVNDMLQWVYNDHKNNNYKYKYIFHVGDIIDLPGFVGDGPAAQWDEAKNIAFRSLPTGENPGIPYGFATGNHDYQWPRGGGEGYGDYTNKESVLGANNFLASMYSGTNHGNSFLDDPLFTKQYPNKPYYLISYREFTVDGLKFVALNLPQGLATSAEAMAKVKQFIHDTPALFILNVHTPYNIKFQGPGFVPLIQENKKIFMVLYGHDPDVVYKNADYAPALSTVIKSGARAGLPAYVYRYDYQQIGSAGKWGCAANNMPQHPLLRVYDFSVNSPNPGELSWTSKDVQAWTENNPVYTSRFWNWGSTPRPTSATEKPYKTCDNESYGECAKSKSFKDQITIKYDDYLN